MLEVLAGDRTPGQVTKAYGVHPNPVEVWKRRFVERAPEIFADETTVSEYERRIRDLELLLRKEVEITLLRFLGRERLSVKARVALVSEARQAHGLTAALRSVGRWRARRRTTTPGTRVTYAEKYAHLEAPPKAIAEVHPEYGYRRATAELRETYGHRVNRKVVERLHRLWDLPLRRASRSKPSAIRRAIDTAVRVQTCCRHVRRRRSDRSRSSIRTSLNYASLAEPARRG